MFSPVQTAGLVLPGPASPAEEEPAPAITAEAALTPLAGEDLRVVSVVAEGEVVAQGQPLMHLRADPGIALVAPMSGRVASIELRPGRRLTQLVLFHEPGADRHRFSVTGAETDSATLRRLMQASGLWRALRSRPYGRMPGPGERTAAIFVMAADTRPGAPDVARALAGQEEAFTRGITALRTLCDGAVLLCEPAARLLDTALPPGVGRIRCGPAHPQGLAGIQIHRHRPVGIGAPVWDLRADDVAGLGTLLATGFLPETRLVSVTGAALRHARLVRCQPGADLRGLAQPVLRPGAYETFSGSALDGRPAHWLGARDRQATVTQRSPAASRHHWFRAALERAGQRLPLIPTAALDQAMGGDLPAAALLRAVAAGDQETAIRLGVLSLVAEDIALADYVTGGGAALVAALDSLLGRIAAEEVPE